MPPEATGGVNETGVPEVGVPAMEPPRVLMERRSVPETLPEDVSMERKSVPAMEPPRVLMERRSVPETLPEEVFIFRRSVPATEPLVVPISLRSVPETPCEAARSEAIKLASCAAFDCSTADPDPETERILDTLIGINLRFLET